MTAEQQVAHRFVMFLTENISTKVGLIDTDSTIAIEVRKHCDELRQAIEMLFADGEIVRKVRRRGEP